MTDAIDLTTEQRKVLSDLLRQFLPGVAVWAYGSRVKWTAHPNSDLDLVAFTTSEQRSQVADLKDALAESNLPFPVDLHVWDDVPERFREIIRKEYVVVQESKQSGSGSDGLGMVEETLPNDWTWTTLGAVADFVNGDRSSNYPAQSDRVEAGVPFINTGHIEPNGRLTSVAMDYITRDSFERLRSGKVKSGDIVYCLRGSTIGKTARNHFTEGAIASSLVIVRAKANVCQEYLYFYLTSPLGQQLVKQHDNGSAQPNLSVRSLCNYPLPLPPLPEQRAIAHILGTLDDKIELNRRMNETREAMARALFKSWFVDFDPVRAKTEGRDTGLPKPLADLFPGSFEDSELGEIPRGWGVKPIGDLADVVGGSTPSTTKPAFWDGMHHWATPKDLSNLSIPVLLDTERRVTDAGLAQISSGLLSVGTVLLSSRAPIGYLAIAEVPVAINQGFIAMNPRAGVSNLFLMLWARSAHDEIVSRANGSTFLEISKANFRPIPLVAPPRDVMRKFDQTARPLYERIVECARETRSLATLRDTLLPKLISGELRVKDEDRFVEVAT